MLEVAPKERKPILNVPNTHKYIFSILNEQAVSCKKCKLCNTPGKSVFGEGNTEADIMFVGEAPGQNEAETGRPFVGKAGILLDNMITSIGFKREDVYICNIVKHRPPYNRKPEQEEVEACLPFLYSQIQVIDPMYIIALGSTAIEALLGPGLGVTKRCGNFESLKIKSNKYGECSIAVMPMFHPAALLRNPKWKEPAWYGMQKVKESYEEFLKI